MPLAITPYNNFLVGQMSGVANAVVNFSADTIKVALATNSYVPNVDTDDFLSDITNEVTGGNYTAGGATILSKNTSLFFGVVIFDGNDVVWLKSNIGFNNARYAIIYKSTGTAATSRLIAYLDFGEDVGNLDDDLFIIWDASHILKFRISSDRGRPKIANGTVVTDIGGNIRGCSMEITTNATIANDRTKWAALRSLGINTVRMDVKTFQYKRSVESNLKFLDLAVECASAENMYIMILNSKLSDGTYSLMELTDFWSKIAKRYKNRSHVFYEITNEPVGGSPYNGSAANWTATILQDFNKLYQNIRRDAPDTLIVHFSTTNLHPTSDIWKTLVTSYVSYGAVNWSNSIIGYHHYQGTMVFGGVNGVDGINALKATYPVLMTETNYWMPGFTDIPPDLLSSYEENDLSWFTLDGRDGSNTYVTSIVSNLNDAGYIWELE
jgi:hypothetical protein